MAGDIAIVNTTDIIHDACKNDVNHYHEHLIIGDFDIDCSLSDHSHLTHFLQNKATIKTTT